MQTREEREENCSRRRTTRRRRQRTRRDLNRDVTEEKKNKGQMQEREGGEETSDTDEAKMRQMDEMAAEGEGQIVGGNRAHEETKEGVIGEEI